MSNKDFLSQFSNENKKPDSFKEEERIPIQKEKKPFNPLWVIIPLVALLIVGAIIYILLFMPRIKVVDFTGQQQADAVAWIKQQEIKTGGIVFKEEYNFENANGIIIEQDPSSGKVNKDAKMTFVVSKGADPDEKIKVPDLLSMNRDSIDSWIKVNKLAAAKINTTYDDTVEEGNVIKVDYSGCDEDSFTRGCSLKISISKGSKPLEEIVVENFVDKTYYEFETWATSKKLKPSKTEVYSNTVDAGKIIAQSPRANEKVKTGDTVNVSVSKGKAVYMGNFVGKNVEEADNWSNKNAYPINKKFVYSSSAKNVVIEQYPSSGSVVNDVVNITVSLGNPDIREFSGATLSDLQQWVDQVNESGAGLHIGNVTKQLSDNVPVGNIISIPNSVGTGSSIDVVVSRGRNIWLTEYVDESSSIAYTWDQLVSDPGTYTEDIVRGYCEFAGVSYNVSYATSTSIDANRLISIKRSDNEPLCINSYIPEDIVIEIVICEERVPEV